MNMDSVQTTRPGVQSLVFMEQQAGYLAGILAGAVAHTHTGKVGIVAGLKIPPVQRFVAGFTLGVHFRCPTCSVQCLYSPFGTGGFSNENNYGIKWAQALVDAGAGVIFGVGGYTGTVGITYAALKPGQTMTQTFKNATGTFTQTFTRTGVKAYVVGVDADEYVTTFKGGAARGAGQIITSALKKVDRAAYLATSIFLSNRQSVRGAFVLNATNQGIGFAECWETCAPLGPVSKADMNLAQCIQSYLATDIVAVPVSSLGATVPCQNVTIPAQGFCPEVTMCKGPQPCPVHMCPNLQPKLLCPPGQQQVSPYKCVDCAPGTITGAPGMTECTLCKGLPFSFFSCALLSFFPVSRFDTFRSF
jgi:basic membrane lipoprotein Med (substrate-binding protein (PBP1-ABC) superfamily)